MRGTYKIRRCRKEAICTEQTWHKIARGDYYLYGACPPEHDINDGKTWRIIRACLKCAERYGLHTNDTRKRAEEIQG